MNHTKKPTVSALGIVDAVVQDLAIARVIGQHVVFAAADNEIVADQEVDRVATLTPGAAVAETTQGSVAGDDGGGTHCSAFLARLNQL